jgi:hypothetical protein
MGLTTAEKNNLVDTETARCGFASLHSADPGATGATELSGGSPAYARKAISWAAAASGAAASSADITFDVGAGSAVKFVGLWSAVSAGTFRGGMAAGSDQPVAFTAKASDDTFTAPGHSYVNGDEVVVIDTGGSSLPTGVSEGTVYFVIGVSGSTFQLSLTSGGSAINLTADGAGHISSQTTETFGGQGTYKIPAGGLVLDLLAVT